MKKSLQPKCLIRTSPANKLTFSTLSTLYTKMLIKAFFLWVYLSVTTNSIPKGTNLAPPVRLVLGDDLAAVLRDELILERRVLTITINNQEALPSPGLPSPLILIYN